jgi:hypothetical protein
MFLLIAGPAFVGRVSTSQGEPDARISGTRSRSRRRSQTRETRPTRNTACDAVRTGNAASGNRLSARRDGLRPRAAYSDGGSPSRDSTIDRIRSFAVDDRDRARIPLRAQCLRARNPCSTTDDHDRFRTDVFGHRDVSTRADANASAFEGNVPACECGDCPCARPLARSKQAGS